LINYGVAKSSDMIPLSIPHLNGNEWTYVKECLDTGWVSSAGKYVNQFEDMVAARAECEFGIAAVNGTLGLHLAMHVLGVGQGDQVVVPNITFVASANAVNYTGAKPLFIDVDPATWQMDVALLERALQEEENIKAIMPVHVLGNIGNMAEILRLSKEYNVPIVEDSTEALGSTYNGRSAGSLSRIGVFSFNGNKILTTGGGAVIVTNDELLAKRMKHLSTQAKTDPETYDHDEIGFNYRLVNILAAMGVAQMEQLDEFLQKKKYIDRFYRVHLEGVGDIRFQKVGDDVDPNCWLFTFRSAKQPEILAALKANNIIARPFWRPMNQLPMFENHLYVSDQDHSKTIHAECLSVPSSVGIGDEELGEVVRVVRGCFG